MTKGKKVLFVIVFLFVLAFLYRYSPRRIEFLGHYNKVFAHRVNSIEKQKQALQYFNGIEFDLVYFEDKNVLDVNHPPAKSIGLTFEEYLAQIDSASYPFLWLDIKKLNTTNEDAILLKLNTLFEARNYPKNKILIETRSPEALPKFTTAGYKTSYYLKPKLYQKKGKELEQEITFIDSVLVSQPNIGISSSYVDYSIMKAHFPNKTKYIWALSSPYRIKDFSPILEDENVAIVLSSFRSFYGNR
ncbi:PI-PLC domain-containing protein [Lacinutrix venerupis]|uniref:Uncharacterized protein n=1 Tax=Lacinutrix venerupis TaxID=1486034 RepID=A0AAC9PWS0_9FLAO|nr:hypothetical protein [Lacinutrix venerupis]APY00175.1 hypothetical protein BWR22_07560 [Lacinutrix venerupis]